MKPISNHIACSLRKWNGSLCSSFALYTLASNIIIAPNMAIATANERITLSALYFSLFVLVLDMLCKYYYTIHENE